MMKESKRETGVSDPEVIVSMTTFPGGVEFASKAIESILRGSVLPDRVVLYITESEFGGTPLPEELLRLERENAVFEIRDYPRNIRSYRKLIPALRDFPEAVIITVDDDVAYGPDMVRKLLALHKRFPDDIIAHRAKRILPLRPYRKWWKYRWYHFPGNRIYDRPDNIQTGVGGVLYPPHALKESMLDEDLFMEEAPTADDIWFWAAAVINGRKIIPVPFGDNKPKGLGKPKEQSLKSVNFKSGEDLNKRYFDEILRRFPELKSKLKLT